MTVLELQRALSQKEKNINESIDLLGAIGLLIEFIIFILFDMLRHA